MQIPSLLIVEDEAVVAEIIARALALHKFNCEVVRAATGEEGLAQFAALVEKGAPPAGLMVDYALPGINGVELLREIAGLCEKHQFACPPAVYMSGYDLEAEGLTPSYMPLEFLYKPFAVSDLLPLARDFFKLST